MLIAVAVLGWVLFLIAAFMFWSVNRQKAVETNALAVMSLLLLLDVESRTLSQERFHNVLRKHGIAVEPMAVIYTMIGGLTEGATSAVGINLSTVLTKMQPYFQQGQNSD